MTRRRMWQALAIVAVWTVVALAAAGQRHFFQVTVGRPTAFGDALLGSLPSCWLWAAFTPAILWLAQRFRIDRGNRVSTVALHTAFSVGFAALDAVLDTAIYGWLGAGPVHTVSSTFFANSLINLFSYFAVLAAAHAWHYHRLFAERELAASRLEAQLLGAQVRALEMQIHPHFLFNTLHTVAALVRAGRNGAAVEMIAGLSDLLRASLRSDGPPEVPLREELAFIERYLAIEQIRFQDRLATRVHAEPAALDALVPALILQPLVENAIRHGVERRAAPGRVEVAALRRNGTLQLRVEDSSTGGAPAGSGREGGGIGLSNTQARLRHLYGDAQRFVLAGNAQGGAVATVELPFHLEPLAHGAVPNPHR
jgi:hypothetical protein